MKEEHKEAPLEFKGAGAVHAHMVNVHALNYNAVKADLKGHFNEFMADPAAFGVEDPDLIAEIKGVKGLSKHFMWKQFKKTVKLKMEDLALDEAASAFILDFEQDKSHQLLTIKQLGKILDDPGNPAFALEADMIEYILDPDFERADFIAHVAAIDADLDVDEDAHGGFGRKVLNFLKGLWAKLAPFVDAVLDFFIDLGTAALKNVLEDHVPDAIADVVDEAIDHVGDAAKELDEVVGAVVDADNDGGDVGGAALDALEDIGGDLAGDLGDAVNDAIDAGMDAIGIGDGGDPVGEDEAVAVVGDVNEAV